MACLQIALKESWFEFPNSIFKIKNEAEPITPWLFVKTLFDTEKDIILIFKEKKRIELGWREICGSNFKVV